jgi:GrpB-like predicted nucleotidyltransferase (UPF0157 family)
VSRAEVDEAVEIVAADASWPGTFDQEAGRLRAALADVEVALEHIGSTAVPGLGAKPIVDVMLGVPARVQSEVVARVLRLGYVDHGGGPGRRYLARRDGKAFNVQVVEHEGELWDANLLLRDFLRSSPEAARRYEAGKRAAAAAEPFLLGYSEAKRRLVEKLLAEARRTA